MIQNSTLEMVLEEMLEQLAKERGEKAASAIQSIILTNQDEGRIVKWLGNDNSRTLRDYVYLVANLHEQYKEYLYQIQVEKSEKVWHGLYQQLLQWAYNYLVGKGFYHNQSTFQLASNYATEASIVLLNSRFPFDRDLMPWMHVLLINICRREIRRNTKASIIPDDKKTSLDIDLVRLHNPSSLPDKRSQELRLTLLDAIERLPQQTWRQVLWLRYFCNLSPSEIAEVMGKTASAVYNLHFKAIAALREIWNPKGYIDE